MKNDQLGNLESALHDLRDAFDTRTERRDVQIGAIAQQVAEQNQKLESVNFRLGALEGVKPLSITQVITPAAALFSLLGVVVGTLMNLQQREQSARSEVVDAKIAAIPDRLNAVWDGSAATGDNPAKVADAMAQKLIGRGQ